MSEKVIVFDTTLRDGEQAAGVCFSEREKLEIASRLAAMRVDVIEAGFPAASDAEAKAVAAVARVVRDATICALARAVSADVDAAAAALRPAARPRIHVFVNSSDIQLAQQLCKSREDVLAMAERAVRRARGYTDDVEFSPMDATRADPEFVAEVVRVALRAGARTINIPDTVGYVLPERLTALLRGLRERVPEMQEAVLSFHGQDDLGLATANALAAVCAGARQVELAVNGLGERAGNTAFEEVVMAFHVHGASLGVHTDVDASGISEISRIVEECSGIAVPPNKPIVGANAFRHASGIHQDGVLKWRENYEVVDPAAIGHPRGSEIVLGKLSGRAGFVSRIAALGIDLAPDGLDRAFSRFQKIANGKPVVNDDDLRAICTAL
ncbi:MAG: 2-isopropylmalate synthase [Deltaproteobacteria bacterium]|nr:2-isopropylmalate synthase [Deltaproteobacteria bacterium]